MPPRDEVRGWARLVAAVADEALAGTVQDMHRSIADGAFRWVGPIGRPIQRITTVVTDAVYATVRASLRAAGDIGAAAADHLGTETDEPTSAAVKARAIATGVVGDEYLALVPELDLEVSLRDGDGREVAVDRAALRRCYPHARSRVAVFVHGLVDTEAVWTRPQGDGTALPEVAREAGATPVLVRYPTGRPVGRNGADLADLLDDLVAAWPVAVTSMAIVGHSMGGLLARAACMTAHERGHRWTRVLDDIVYLGTPHLGSWLEKLAAISGWALRRSSRSAPLGDLLDGRSQGIKDLRVGTDEPWLDGVDHHLVVGRLRSAPRHPLNLAIGDALVRTGSAAGHNARRQIGAGGRVIVAPVDASHSRLVRHPEVADLVRRVMVSRTRAVTSVAAG